MAFLFEAQTKEKKNIVFICNTNFHQIDNISAKETIMNISEYQISNITSKGYDCYVAISEDTTLQKVVDDYDYAVCYSTDTEFEGDKFFEHLHELIKSEFLVAGHILDRKEGWYEIHEQCYVLNLKKYKEYECPEIGEAKRNAEHFETVPIRSDENFHDDHTPLWIKPGIEMEKYKHKWHGWNLLRTAFDNKEEVLVFDENIRHSKRCYYAAHETDYIENSSHILKKYNLSASRLFYPINTEEVVPLPDFVGPIKQLVTPASGFNWLKYLDKYGYDEDTEVIFYDYNPNALYYMQTIIEKFEGGDLHKFLKQNNTHRTPDWINSKKDIADYISKIGGLLTLRSKLKFKYVECDLLNEFNLKIKNHKGTILNISNIFAYEPTAAMVPTKQRVFRENKLIKLLNEKYDKIHLIASMHSWTGFVDYPMLAGPVTKFTECDIESMRAPLWRFGKDWKNPKDPYEDEE